MRPIDRSLLGPLDVTDADLAAMVAAQLGGPAEVLTSEVTASDYALPAITTAARWWVSGTSTAGDYRFFVKHVQDWAQSPWFAFVPEEFRAVAAALVPWRTEGAIYRSDLVTALPSGLTMPTARAIVDLDASSYAVWLDAVPVVEAAWTTPRSARAAYLLGRLAASDAVAPYARLADVHISARQYADGRVAGQILPILHSDLWAHPAFAAFEEVRPRLMAAAARVTAYADELDALPVLTAHGDACPNNLLVTADAPEGFTLIDYGFWGVGPVGFDLGQLLVGDVNVGRAPAAGLAEVDAAIVPAYVAGLRAEGCDLDEAVVRRAHAVQTFLYTGLSALPFELVDQLPPDALAAVATERAALTTYTLDRLEATA